MATRSRRSWKPDPRGYYSRQLGWEVSRSGKLQQHKFLLGTDRKEAERRERKLRELWDSFCETCAEERPLWPEALLVIAKKVASGMPEIPVSRGPTELQHLYAARIQRMQAKYPVIHFRAEDQYAYEVGQAALQMFEPLPSAGLHEIHALDERVASVNRDAQHRTAVLGTKFSTELTIVPGAGVNLNPLEGALKPSDPAARRANQSQNQNPTAPLKSLVDHANTPQVMSRTPGATLFQAFKAYQKYLEKEYFDPEVGHINDWGKTQVRQIKNLQQHHADQLLARLNSDAILELVGYWRRRPFKIGTMEPMTAKSCTNFLGTLVRFLKWLDQTNLFDWNKPFAFSDIDTKIRRLPSDLAKKSLQQVDTFSLEELKLLMHYGQPFDRLLLLLGLNCGFGRAEIASLLVGEVYLFQGHSEREQEILNHRTTDEDSFIKRIRRKSGVYGEHLLFPMTVEGIQWAVERRKQFPEFGREAKLVVSEKGTELDKRTKNINANQIIPNHFNRLIKRIKDDGKEISQLSFGKLRKTASDLIKRFSNGEVAGVFDCHGSPVKSDTLSDEYTNRPFGKVFQAIREVQEYLAPVFLEAGPAPFAIQAQAYTKRSTIDQIIELYSQGRSSAQIAMEVGLSESAVGRHVQRHLEHNKESSVHSGRPK